VEADEAELRGNLRFAVEDSGQAHQRYGGTGGTLLGAIAHAIAVLAEIGGFKRNVLHCGECHLGTPIVVGITNG
jgi:hypothetical protein